MFPFKKCRKGLHYIAGENALPRLNYKGTHWNSCRACHNERLKLYMRKRRQLKKEKGNAVDYHVDPLK